MRRTGNAAAIAIAIAIAIATATATALSLSTPAAAVAQFGGVTLREIGPANMSGRIVDLDVNALNPYVIYAAAATGGVWKSSNNGITWTPVFHRESTHSVGDIAVHPVDTATVWVGTGERASRQSNSWGDGVYKSIDGGLTWRNMGLRDSKAIGRIALHPTDSRIVFVAAMGHLWGPNDERGLYKSTDGGESWRRTLAVDQNTGVVDVAIDPADPSIMYAASYQRRRTPFGFDGGGPGSALWKSTDAGETWTKLAPTATAAGAAVATTRQVAAGDTIGAATASGLPRGEYGRIGISIYARDPRIVYASIEQGYRYNASTAYTQRVAGLYRSEDRGQTWTHMSDWNPRPMYASQPLVDPNDDQRIYMLNSYSWSDDGGKTFTSPNQSLHGDDRLVWVDPRDSRHIMKADDGGLGISYDRGRTFLFVTSLPISQWYHVAVDNAKPFNVYGGLQDNGSWVGPSATYRSEGILNEDWTRTGGGDGFLSLADTTDDRTFYSESQYLGLLRLDRGTWEARDIRPGDPRGHIGDRRNWDAWGAGRPEPELLNAMAPGNWDGPFIISPHDPATLYAGTNRLWRSTDRGTTWTSLGDLTTKVNRRDLPIMGRRAADYTPSLDDGAPYYPTLTVVAESPLRRGLLYVGTDDGNVQVSTDGGATWGEVSGSMPGLPANAWINDVEPSRTDANTVYIVANNYRNDDYANYLYRSTDAGRTWTSLAASLPADRVHRAIREDPRNPRLLWLGTELGLFFSRDAGTTWTELKANLPTIAINDLLVHPRDNDLVLATHGRGVWILDNVNAFQELMPEVMASSAKLFTIEPAEQIRYHADKAHTGDMLFEGRNPPEGAIIDYWLNAAKDSGAISLDVLDGGGQVVASLPARRAAGVNRVVWDLRHARLPARPGRAARGPAGPLVVPGTYVVRLTVDGQAQEQRVDVREDPRVQLAAAPRAAWTADLMAIASVYRDATALTAEVRPAAARLKPLRGEGTTGEGERSGEDMGHAPAGAGQSGVVWLTGREETRTREIVALVEELVNRVAGLYSAVDDWTGPMTGDQRTQLDFYRAKVTELRGRLNELPRAR